jgi:hypothetical protein
VKASIETLRRSGGPYSMLILRMWSAIGTKASRLRCGAGWDDGRGGVPLRTVACGQGSDGALLSPGAGRHFADRRAGRCSAQPDRAGRRDNHSAWAGRASRARWCGRGDEDLSGLGIDQTALGTIVRYWAGFRGKRALPAGCGAPEGD